MSFFRKKPKKVIQASDDGIPIAKAASSDYSEEDLNAYKIRQEKLMDIARQQLDESIRRMVAQEEAALMAEFGFMLVRGSKKVKLCEQLFTLEPVNMAELREKKRARDEAKLRSNSYSVTFVSPYRRSFRYEYAVPSYDYISSPSISPPNSNLNFQAPPDGMPAYTPITYRVTSNTDGTLTYE